MSIADILLILIAVLVAYTLVTVRKLQKSLSEEPESPGPLEPQLVSALSSEQTVKTQDTSMPNRVKDLLARMGKKAPEKKMEPVTPSEQKVALTVEENKVEKKEPEKAEAKPAETSKEEPDLEELFKCLDERQS